MIKTIVLGFLHLVSVFLKILRTREHSNKRITRIFSRDKGLPKRNQPLSNVFLNPEPSERPPPFISRRGRQGNGGKEDLTDKSIVVPESSLFQFARGWLSAGTGERRNSTEYALRIDERVRRK